MCCGGCTIDDANGVGAQVAGGVNVRWKPDWLSVVIGIGVVVLGTPAVRGIVAANREQRLFVTLIVLLSIWFIAATVVLGYYKGFRSWLSEPGQSIRLSLWIGATLLVTLTLLSPESNLLGGLRTEAIGIALTVIVIDELGRYRERLERKQEIIEQMGSRVNSVALEAVRLADRYGWLYDGSFKGANLYDANLIGIRLKRARLLIADLRKVSAWNTNFEGAFLNAAKCQDAEFEGANFKGANLQLTNFKGAHLEGADFTGASLMATNFTGAHLDGTIFRGAIYYESTKWPNHFDPQAAGAILVANEDEDGASA